MYNKFHHVETQNLLGDMTLRSAKSANRRESLHVLNVINKPTFTNPKQSFVIRLWYGSCFVIMIVRGDSIDIHLCCKDRFLTAEHQGSTVFDELSKSCPMVRVGLLRNSPRD